MVTLEKSFVDSHVFERGNGMNGPERRKIQIFVGFQKFLQIQWFMEKSLSPKHPITIITTLQFK